MTDLLELAARVEQAEGPDEALNWDIMRALGWTEQYDSRLDVWCWIRPDGLVSGHRRGDPCWRRFTESIDAAMTLVPDKFSCQMWLRFNEGKRHEPRAAIWSHDDGDYTRSRCNVDAGGATLALALCCAALRARAAA